jgi:hypothetical protein
MATVDGMSEDVGKCDNAWQQAGRGSSDEQQYVFGSCFKGKGLHLKADEAGEEVPHTKKTIHNRRRLLSWPKTVSNTRQSVSICVLMWRTWGL